MLFIVYFCTLQVEHKVCVCTIHSVNYKMYRQCGQCPVWTLSKRQCAEEVLPALLCASKEGGRKRSNWTLSKGQAEHGKLLKLMMPKRDQDQEQEKDEDETIEQLNNFCNLSIYHCNLSGRIAAAQRPKVGLLSVRLQARTNK